MVCMLPFRLAFLPICLLALPAARAQGPCPGSLLLFPEYDTQGLSLLTVTNTSLDVTTGAVSTRWVYVNANDCSGTAFDVLLAPGDTYSVAAGALFPAHQRGYAYVYATHPSTGQAIAFNHLIGASLRIEPVPSGTYEIQPLPFRAVSAPTGAQTDFNNDGQPNLDGVEYEGVPDQVVIPRFLGQGAYVQSDLVMLSLTGRSPQPIDAFCTIYNDNEETFTQSVTFQCWDRRPLAAVSGFFTKAFLVGTNDAPGEIALLDEESGWARFEGLVTGTEPDPAVLAFLIDRVQGSGVGGRPAAVPGFGRGVQFNGRLAPPGGAEPPACTTDRSVTIWPPNHQVESIDVAALAGVTDPAGLPVTLVITAITQDEPVDANGNGDGNTVCDGSGIGTSIAHIRAERAGNGDGRVYVVSYTATNSLGLACSGSISVGVPHSQNGTPAVDSGQAFDSTGGCP